MTPELTSAFQVLNYFVNELNYNAGPSNPGAMFWLDWFGHDADSALGNEDANGSILRLTVLASCSQLTTSENVGTLLATLLGLKTICHND
jgi:hypothetical protein